MKSLSLNEGHRVMSRFWHMTFLFILSGTTLLLADNALAQASSTLRAPAILGDSPIMSELANDLAPNILLIFDNSTSMRKSYTPDELDDLSPAVKPGYFLRFGNGANNPAAKNNRATTKYVKSNLSSDYKPASILSAESSSTYYPPILSAGFNRQAYNPAVTYLPAQVVGGWGKLPQWARNRPGMTDPRTDVVTFPNMNKQTTNNWTWIPAGSSSGEYWDNTVSTISLANQSTRTTTVVNGGSSSTFNLKGFPNLNYRFNMGTTDTRILKKYFVDIGDSEVSELFTFYCDNGTKYEDIDKVFKYAGLTWQGCTVSYLPLHYYKTSVKWCDKPNNLATGGASWSGQTVTDPPLWPGQTILTSNLPMSPIGFGDKNSNCVDSTDDSYEPVIHKYPYFHYPFGDKMTPRKDDNTKFNPFIPVILDLENESKIYTHHRIDSRGKLVAFTRTFEEEMTNYLNWFVYYGTRERAAKTVISRVFKEIPPNMHVGFVRLAGSGSAGTDSLSGVPINSFAGAHRTDFYTKLLALGMETFTPMKGRMSKVYDYFQKQRPLNGRCPVEGSFANNNCAPIQYACQRNYVLMMTDGVWNDNCNSGSTNYDVAAVGVLPDPDVNNAIVYGQKLDATKPWPRPIYHGNIASTCQTLADLTLYYWKQDVAPHFAAAGQKNIVPPTASDPATWPHLNFSALGFGVQGQFATNNPNRIIADLKSGAKNWPGVASSPTYSYLTDPRTDDLWHAAINGFGLYLSSQTPEEFEGALRSWINGVVEMGGTEANAAYESQRLDRSAFAYVPSYAPGWSGDLKKVEIDLTTGEQKPDGSACSPPGCWSASEKLKEMLEPKPGIPEPWRTERKIYTLHDAKNGATPKTQIEFSFNQLHQKQRDTLGDTPASQQAMIAYIRGDTSNEGTGAGQYRRRTGPLGDIVNSRPVYVGPPHWEYEGDGDEVNAKNRGHATFKATHSKRKGVVYVGANDGMLHAFDAKTGEELWAYIPTDLFRSAAQGGLAALASTTWQGEISDGSEDLPQEYLDAWRCLEDASDDENAPSPLDEYGYCPGYGPVCDEGERDPEYRTCPGFYPGDVPRKNCAENEKIGKNCPPIDLSGSGLGGTMNMFFHRYYVDATPRVMDAKVDGVWKTVLVSGLGKGGTSYFAIDVTDPRNPKVMWEFTDPNMGYTYGRASFAKTKNNLKYGGDADDWSVLMPSGYNNGTGRGQPKKGDGIARLYVAKLKDGVTEDIAELDADNYRVVAGHGTRSWPAGMGHIMGFVDSPKDQTVRVVYGGDQRGMLWRFVLDSSDKKNWSGSKLGYHLRDKKNNWQPVSTEPAVAVDGKNRRWVFAGTGRLTSAADLNSKIGNTMYGYLDGYWDPTKSSTDLANKTRTHYGFTNRNSNCMKDIQKEPAGECFYQYLPAGGWYHDFPAGYHVIARPEVLYGYVAYAATTYTDAVKGCDDSGAKSLLYIRKITDGSIVYYTDPNADPADPTTDPNGPHAPIPGAITGLTFLGTQTGGIGGSRNLSIGVVVNGKLTSVEVDGFSPVGDGEGKIEGHLKGAPYFLRVLD
jgi:Tfp pilus tip-associated adhesin PilY1